MTSGATTLPRRLPRRCSRVPSGGLQSADFCASNLSHAQEIEDHPSFLANAINLAEIEGFRAGVRGREQAPYHDHRRADARTCIRFDSFEGFPNPGSANMSRHLCASPATAAPSNITLFKGCFDNKLPSFSPTTPTRCHSPMPIATCIHHASSAERRAARWGQQRKRDVWAHCDRCGVLQSSKPERSEETR